MLGATKDVQPMLNAVAPRAATAVRASRRHLLSAVNLNDSHEQIARARSRDTAAFAFALEAPNPSFERTHNGRPLQALISFWALRVLPSRAAQLKRWVLQERMRMPRYHGSEPERSVRGCR